MSGQPWPLNPATLTPVEFEQHLPELFASHHGRISDDPELRGFLDANPTCAALVRDLEYIADAAKSLLESSEEEEPSDAVWQSIQNKLKSAASSEDPQ